jgi:hypothetical protein
MPNDPEQVTTNSNIMPKRSGQRQVLLITTLLIVVFVAGGFTTWWLFIRKPVSSDPFTAQLEASLQFPLYYPTWLPNGYHLDTRSITEPQAGVLTFDIVNSANMKIYVSEEAIPTHFSISSYTAKLRSLKQSNTVTQSIAVGYGQTSNVAIGSLYNDKTWLLANTSAPLSLEQVMEVMKSFTLSY